jgi:hypothetical protein
MSELAMLMREVAERLDANVERHDGTYHLTVTVEDGENTRGGGDTRTQLVTVDLTEDENHVLVGTIIGDFDSSMDLERMLRRMSNAIYARLYIDDDDKLALEAGVATEDLDSKRLAKVCRELARMGDDFENRFVGGDAR